jgi:hypothetical protein
LKIGLGSFRQEPLPGVIKIDAGLFEGRRRTVLMLARMRARIEAARPAPRILVERNAGADLDRARADVAPIDVSALLWSVSRAAAGEFGHEAIQALNRKRGKSLFKLNNGMKSFLLPIGKFLLKPLKSLMKLP